MLRVHNISKTLSQTNTEKKTLEEQQYEARMILELVDEHWEFHQDGDNDYLDKHGTDLFISDILDQLLK